MEKMVEYCTTLLDALDHVHTAYMLPVQVERDVRDVKATIYLEAKKESKEEKIHREKLNSIKKVVSGGTLREIVEIAEEMLAKHLVSPLVMYSKLINGLVEIPVIPEGAPPSHAETAGEKEKRTQLNHHSRVSNHTFNVRLAEARAKATQVGGMHNAENEDNTGTVLVGLVPALKALIHDGQWSASTRQAPSA